MHLFGTGHSRIPVEELFPRYGSYPGFHPIVELSMTFHTQVVGANGQRQAMFIERVEGLAETILANFELAPPDAMIVFSVGGTTAVPIEMACGARRRGLQVVAVTSVEHSRPGGRALAARGCSTTPTSCSTCARRSATRWSRSTASTRPSAPGSSLAAVALVNEMKVRATARAARRARAMPPVLTSAAVVGPRARRRELFDAGVRGARAARLGLPLRRRRAARGEPRRRQRRAS